MKALPPLPWLLETFAFPVGVPRQLRPGLTILWIAMGLAVLAHTRWMPLWAILLILAALVAHTVTMVQWPRQRQFFDNIAVIVLMVLLTQVHHNFPDRETGIAVFPILFLFKLRQLYQLRDYHVLCMMACVQTGLIFLYQQSILTLLYVCFICVLLVFAMANPYLPDDHWKQRERIRLVARICGQSLPFLLVLFVLFPRIPGPLWSLPRNSELAKTGISDTLDTGGLRELVQSDRVVFRVSFDGEAPENSSLYWRGPVLWSTSGNSWFKGAGSSIREVAVSGTGSPVSYTMTMEAQQDDWLFALGLPDPPPPGTRLTPDLQLLSTKNEQTRQLYQVRSYLEYQVQELEPRFLGYATRLVPGKHPETRKLARQWIDAGYSGQQLIDQALTMFNEDFSYTMQPPLMQNDPVDEFLFTHKAGFCGHFASAFATLMRAAGIPARVIIGFQGGEYNDIGDFFLVRELDAHAWVEVWLPERGGWVQVDPTAAVAPQRIETGMREFMLSETGQRAGAPVSIADALPFTFHRRFANWIDAVQHNWNRNVLQYDRKKQSELLRKTGIPGIDSYLWLLLAALLLVLALVTVMVFFRRPPSADPAKALYDIFCAKLERAGLPWHQWQPPLQRQQLASSNWPDKAREINKITRLYLALRYGAGGNINQFKLMVKKFGIK